MNEEQACQTASRPPLPAWLLTLFLLVVIAGHTQVTLRNLALRMAGVRTGQVTLLTVTELMPADATGGIEHRAVIHDEGGLYRIGELAGTRLWLGEQVFDVIDNTHTHIVLDAPEEQLAAVITPQMPYFTGVAGKGLLVRLALRVPSIGITVADLLLCIFGIALAGWLLISRSWSRLRLPPVPILVLLGIAALSCFDRTRLLDRSGIPTDLSNGIQEWLQYAEVLLFGWLGFYVVLRDSRARRWLMVAMILMALVVVVCGWIEYVWVFGNHSMRGLLDVSTLDSVFGFRYNPSRSSLTGSEASHNILALYLAIIIPLLLAMSRAVSRRSAAIGLWVLAAAAMALILSLPLLVCAFSGAALVLAFRPNWRLAVPAFCGGTLLVLGLLVAINQHHGFALIDSVAIHRTLDAYGRMPMPMTGLSAPEAGRNWESLQQKYLERQAALTAVSWSPLLGHGVGNYQAKINSFYAGTRPELAGHIFYKKPANLMERDTHGLYFVQLVETGILGLLALLWLLFSALAQSFRNAGSRPAGDRWDRALAIGVVGSLMVLVGAGLWGSFLVRGLQFIILPMLVLPFVQASANAEQAAIRDSGNTDCASADIGE